MSDLVKLVARFEAETAQYHRKLDAMGRRISAFEKQQNSSLKRIQTSFRTAFAALGIGAVVRQLATITKGTLDYADSVAEASDALGITTKSYQELQYATSQAGLKQDQFTQSFSKFVQFAQDAAQGKKGPAETFARVGITAEEAGGNVDELFDKFVKGLDNIASESEKLQIIGDAFGAKVAAKWAATIGQGLDQAREKAQRLGLVLSEDNIRAMGQLADAVDTLGVKFKVAFAEGLAKGLIGDSVELKDLWTDPRFLQAVDDIAAGFRAVGKAIGSIPAAIEQVEQYSDLIEMLTTMAAGARVGTALGGPGFGTAMGVLGGGAVGAFEIGTRKARNEKNAAPVSGGLETGMSMIPEAGMSTFAGYTPAQLDAMVPKLKEATAVVRDHAVAEREVAEAFDFASERTADLTSESDRLDAVANSYLSILNELDDGTRAYGDALAELDVLVQTGRINQEQSVAIAGKLAEELDTYSNAVREMAESLQEDLKGATSNLFQDLIQDPKNWKDALLGYIGQVGDAFAKMAADMATQALFGSTGGGGGGGINWGGLIGGLFGAALGGATGGGSAGGDIGGNFYGGGGGGLYNHTFAAGGIMSANSVSLVGENGPELVMSRQAMRVFSNDQTQGILGGGGTTLVQNFAVKDFDSFKRSERQMRQHGKAALGIA